MKKVLTIVFFIIIILCAILALPLREVDYEYYDKNLQPQEIIEHESIIEGILEEVDIEEFDFPDVDYKNYIAAWKESGNFLHKIEQEVIIPKEYKLTYAEYEESTYTYGECQQLMIPEKEHYTFHGWGFSEDSEELFYFLPIETSDDIVLYANFTPEVYHIEYNLEGGKLSEEVYTYEAFENKTLPIATKNGYNFLGWYINDTKIETTKDLFENLTLIAKWKEIPKQIISKNSIQNNRIDTNSNQNNNNQINSNEQNVQSNESTTEVKTNNTSVVDRITVGSYSANLYWSSSQATVDAVNSAGIFPAYGYTFIADHNAQGFTAILYNNVATITLNGQTYNLKKVETTYGEFSGSKIKLNSTGELLKAGDLPGRYIMYTCDYTYSPNGVVLTSWSIF